MNVSIYQAAAALNADARWQDMISQNLASSAVPGFKKQEISFAAVQAGLISPTPLAGLNHHFSMPTATTATNFQQGQMRATDVPTDVGLEGPGFFEVQLPNGDTAYTRDGEFHLSSQGQLVSKEGYAVLSDGGPIQIDKNNTAPLSISPTGVISQGADNKGKLKVTDFNHAQLLNPIGHGYYLANDPALQPTEATNTTMRQGFLEAGNTSSVAEMAHLITAMRHFEANQRIMQMQDERMGRVISDLSEPV